MADNSTIQNATGVGGGSVWYFQYFGLVVGLAVAFGLLLFLFLYCIIVAICACVCCRKCGRRGRGEARPPRSESALGLMEKQMTNTVDPIFVEMGVVGGLLQGENSVHNPAFVTGVATERQIEFPRTNICILRELGETTFGPLCLGEATGLDENELSTTVLIKTLKLGATPTVQEEFNNELNWAVEFKHPNILPLLAVCTRDQPKYLIYDYLEYGTLKHFLQSTASALEAFDDALTELADDSTSTLQCHPVLELEALIKFSKQIASAMQYLGEKGFVHQDLATRNVHVGKSMVAKIANFGFSRDVHSSDYYHMKDLRDKLLPVRWLAPETLKEGIYSPETDMWAYGVVLWEIFSCGQTPYKTLSNPEVIQRILKAKPLPRPAHCPDDVYRIMLACWRKEPQMRPTFREVSRQLEKFELTSPRPRSRGWSWRKGIKVQQQRRSSQAGRLPKTPERTRQNSDATL